VGDHLPIAEQQITEALAELRAARLDHQHSPNSDTELTVEYAELRLNRMLDRYCGCGRGAATERVAG
jgi:methylase of polypeptide subunit release factors